MIFLLVTKPLKIMIYHRWSQVPIGPLPNLTQSIEPIKRPIKGPNGPILALWGHEESRSDWISLIMTWDH